MTVPQLDLTYMLNLDALFLQRRNHKRVLYFLLT